MVYARRGRDAGLAFITFSMLTMCCTSCARGPYSGRVYYTGWTGATKSFPYRNDQRLAAVAELCANGAIDERQAESLMSGELYGGMPEWAFWLAVGRPDDDLVVTVRPNQWRVEYLVAAEAGGMMSPSGWRLSEEDSPTRPGIVGLSKYDSWLLRNSAKSTDTLRAVFEGGALVPIDMPRTSRAAHPLYTGQ